MLHGVTDLTVDNDDDDNIYKNNDNVNYNNDKINIIKNDNYNSKNSIDNNDNVPAVKNVCVFLLLRLVA